MSVHAHPPLVQLIAIDALGFLGWDLQAAVLPWILCLCSMAEAKGVLHTGILGFRT
jgi:hypothetical protein